MPSIQGRASSRDPKGSRAALQSCGKIVGMTPYAPWYSRLASPLILVAGSLSYVAVLRVLLATQNPNLFPTLLLIGSVTVPLAVLVLVCGLERQPTGHAGLVAITAIVGGAIGTTSAGLLEYSTLKHMPWLGMLAVGVIEESVKLVVPVIIYLTARRRTEGLGVLLGVASGTGFAVLETMGYGFTTFIESRGNVDAVDQTLLLRAMLAPAGHVAWTGLATWALWRIGDRPRHRLTRLTLVLTFVAVVLLHATWDSSDVVLIHVGVAVVSVCALCGAVIADDLRTRRVQREQAVLPRRPEQTE